MERREAPFEFMHDGIKVKGVVAYTGYHHPDYTVSFTLDGKEYQFRLVLTVPGNTLRYSVGYLSVPNDKGVLVPKHTIKGVSQVLVHEGFGAGIEAAIAIHRMDNPPTQFDYVPQAPF